MSGLPLISRRRLLTAMALSPLLWQMNTAHAAAIDPNRIVALEWLPVELLLALRHRALRRGGYHQLSPVGQRTTIAGLSD
ncbi:iron-hydroxamate transporter substrate-binding subunit [Escherichia coli]|uniref:Iron-hydroxamate transporter substrate-binding subunit n=1 Tax=Escherichia coli TaxID=562 RepID=A0A376RP55_ECOLX|nr:iron-hydroxamate transporter substrate-binding subunit [Escherichia coli]